MSEKMKRNPNWTREELILALDLYFRKNPSSINSHHPEVKAVSDTLRQLYSYPNVPNPATYRGTNSVYMKLMNFSAIDPSRTSTALKCGSKLDQLIWNEFASNREKLTKTAELIRQNIEQKNKNVFEEPTLENEDNECDFVEGNISYRLHKYRERNQKVVKDLKNNAIKRGKLKCQACGFDFAERYGDVGHGFIECHDTIPLSEYEPNPDTKIEDLVLVCSNCHKMLHKYRPWLRKNEVEKLIEKTKLSFYF
jgi:5-methylcytosine-specific restriction protein A